MFIITESEIQQENETENYVNIELQKSEIQQENETENYVNIELQKQNT